MHVNSVYIFASLLAVVAISQAAPSPANNAIDASDAAAAPFVAQDPNNASKNQSGVAVGESGRAGLPLPDASPGLDCWDESTSGADYSITCSGDSWRVWTDCSNRYRYTAGPLSGSFRAKVHCPAGATVVQGGAF
ncbi:hypothetical protein BGX28_009378 [Mortierella sp. GBA30]|nr:hypothetical protein BGX28_009378 [Mortierella sp. GBA30]